MTAHPPAQPVAAASSKASATGREPRNPAVPLISHPVPDHIPEAIAPHRPHGLDLDLRFNPGPHRTEEDGLPPLLIYEIEPGARRRVPRAPPNLGTTLPHQLGLARDSGQIVAGVVAEAGASDLADLAVSSSHQKGHGPASQQAAVITPGAGAGPCRTIKVPGGEPDPTGAAVSVVESPDHLPALGPRRFSGELHQDLPLASLEHPQRDRAGAEPTAALAQRLDHPPDPVQIPRRDPGPPLPAPRPQVRPAPFVGRPPRSICSIQASIARARKRT
jgi:hypothetical protein